MFGFYRRLMVGIAYALLSTNTIGVVVSFKTGQDTSPADSLDDKFTMLVHSGTGAMNPTASDFLAARTSTQHSFILSQPPLFLPDHPDPNVEFLGSTPTANSANASPR